MFIYSYKGFTIAEIFSCYWITYPNEREASVWTTSYEKAKQFVDEMTK